MNRKTKIVGSVMAATLFASLFVGSTLALYSSTKVVNNHITAGNMHAMFYLKTLEVDYLKTDGTIGTENKDLTSYVGYDTQEQGVNLAEYTDEVFMSEKVVPTMEGKAQFKIVNAGNVAFEFSISLINKKGYVFDSTANDYVEDPTAAILSQLDVVLVDAAPSDNVVKANSSYEFGVNYVFKDLANNNDAMNQKITFDISVVCTQVTKS